MVVRRWSPDAADLLARDANRRGKYVRARYHEGPDAKDLPARDECREAALVSEEDQNRAPEKRVDEDGCPEEKID